MRPASLRRAWKMKHWMPRLSGLMFEPSTADSGVAAWISSLRDIRASHSASPDESRLKTTHDICGRTSVISWPISGQGSLFSRTCPIIYDWASNKSTMIYESWVTALRRACLRRKKSVRHKRERLFILAYAEGAGTWLDQSWLPEGFGGDGATLVDATRQRDQRTSGYISEAHGGPDGRVLRLPDGAGNDMADTLKQGLEGFSWHEKAGDGADVTCGNCLPPWPPGPRDIEAWGCIAAPLKPAVHRMADGMADRVDRIRLCGNGVVPLAAAYAFRTLASFIEG